MIGADGAAERELYAIDQKVACAWVLGRPGVTSVVVGARDRAQLIGSLGAEQVVLPAEIRSALDDESGALADMAHIAGLIAGRSI